MRTMPTTLVFLRRDDEILLAMKKRGFGADKWNGIGGKVDEGETIEQAMIRECQEEILVTPIAYHQVAVHNFDEPYKGERVMNIVHTYICTAWKGTPAETEEMAPKWFAVADIPYDQMWPDDKFWLPSVLAGKLIESAFTFDDDYTMVSHKIAAVQGF